MDRSYRRGLELDAAWQALPALRFTAAVNLRPDYADAFFALASIVADVMYGKSFPVIALEPDDFASLRTGEQLQIDRSGTITRK